MPNDISKPALELKSRKVDEIRNILKKQKTDFELLSVVLEELEGIQTILQKILSSFSDVGAKEFVKSAHEEIRNEIADFGKTKEEVEELLAYLKKEQEINVVIGALEIVARDGKDPILKRNLENLIFHLKEYGTTENPMILLSRASWKW
ncbi:MAG: hypothetical protein Athens071416_516 [Parcubacteria group bacterium Athens0714_16]|nr:MAG: hypothetical protein Athens071416_516 [Parcubacteria group bacterium Athens0714_16]